MLDGALAQGGVLLLLDGLDEVKAMGRRQEAINRALDFFAFHREQGNKLILTSRIVGYREVRPSVEGLAECTLVDFDEEEIEQFVRRWTAALEKAALGETAVAAADAQRERDELLHATRNNPGVRRLASNPLLLTILAMMKRQGVTLPERRVELYEQYVRVLLKQWNQARGLAANRTQTRDLDVVETVRVLAPLALSMHETSPGVGLVRQQELRRRLEQIYRERDATEPEQVAGRLLDDAREHAGLLVERGAGTFGFLHLTFQEYLAAVAIGQLGQSDLQPIVDALAAHIGDDNWHEVAMLTIGYLGIVQQRDEAAGEVLLNLIERAPGEPGQAAVLAGEAVADAWLGGVTPACREKVITVLLGTIEDDRHILPVQRAAAGTSLARLGDPRDEVMHVDDMQFCYVPAGQFWMGSDDSREEDERPLHQVAIPYDYWLGRYPVTNAQFAEFVAGIGYEVPDLWPEALAADRWRQVQFRDWGNEWRGQPRDYGYPFTLDNHQVVAVSWYEALAFARWLTRCWQAAGCLRTGRSVCRRRRNGKRRRGVENW